MSSDVQGSFKTHASYIRSFALIAGFSTPSAPLPNTLSVVAGRVKSSSVYGSVRSGSFDLQALKRSLANAWGTELLLWMSGEYASDEELLGIVNNWGVVQVYYITMHATRAMAAARNGSLSATHEATQRRYVDLWIEPVGDIAPWSLGYGVDGPCNIPAGIQCDDAINTMTRVNGSTAWSFALQAIRTTWEEAEREAHGRARGEKRRAKKTLWEKEEQERVVAGRKARKPPTFRRPYLTQSEKQEASASVRRYSMMDYFYRLRRKTNYEDSSVFTDGPASTSASRSVHKDLVNLAAAIMLVYENMIAKRIGRQKLTGIIDEWLASRRFSDNIGIALRRPLL